MDCKGECISDQVTLKEMARNFYLELLASNPNAGGDFIKGLFPCLPSDSLAFLESEFKVEELELL